MSKLVYSRVLLRSHDKVLIYKMSFWYLAFIILTGVLLSGVDYGYTVVIALLYFYIPIILCVFFIAVIKNRKILRIKRFRIY